MLDLARSVEAASRALAGTSVRLTGELVQRGVAQTLGARSPAGMLREALNITAGHARGRVAAAVLPSETPIGHTVPSVLPEVLDALSAGNVCEEQAVVVVDAITGLPAEVDERLGRCAIPLDSLLKGLGSGWADYTGPITAATARLLACDANLIPQVLGSDSVVLDQGRAARLLPPEIRRAITTRDRGCSFPGCDIRPDWCDAHHILWWERDLGPTSERNGCLLCRRHHALVHRGDWQIRLFDTGRPEFIPHLGSTPSRHRGSTDTGSCPPSPPETQSWRAAHISAAHPPGQSRAVA